MGLTAFNRNRARKARLEATTATKNDKTRPGNGQDVPTAPAPQEEKAKKTKKPPADDTAVAE